MENNNISTPQNKNQITMKTKYGAMAATTIPFIIIGGTYLAMAYMHRSGWRIGRSTERPRVLKKAVALGVLHGGKLALQRLVDYQEARADGRKMSSVECELKLLLANDNPDFVKLQRTVAKMEMSGNEDKAVKMLQERKIRDRNEGKIHEAYEIEMLLVEMLIYKGEFEKAFSCKCLNEDTISDARRPLYKAIILIAIERPRYEKSAKESWEKFKEVREDFDDPPSLKEGMRECLEEEGLYKLTTNFDEFKKVVKRLKDDIHNAQAKKKKKKQLMSIK